MPPDTDIIQEGHNAHAKDIEQGNRNQDDGVEQQGHILCGGVIACNNAKYSRDTREPGMQQHGKGDGCGISDTCGNSNLSDQVKQARVASPSTTTTPPK